MRIGFKFPLGFMAGVLFFLSTTLCEAAIIRDSTIITTVTEVGGVYTYQYTVKNISPGDQFGEDDRNIWPLIVGYEIPLDSPANVFDVVSPDDWDFLFLDSNDYTNPFGSSYVLRWYDTDPPPGGGGGIDVNFAKTIAPDGFNDAVGPNPLQHEPQLSGFEMKSTISPIDGPYASLWLDFEPLVGDPPLPGQQTGGGSTTGGSPMFTPNNSVPEPSTFALLGIGSIALIGYACRKTNKT